ncbi:hypothetical protein EDD86DRAFT_202294 [Gorgonomyces haynaldii]|nr:hypothetical protein EDD86DRAFT_202294 [Gorgonomyces haynaldii]
MLRVFTKQIRRLTTAEIQYHKQADRYLESLQQKLEDLGDSLDWPGYDVEFSSGVLTLKLPPQGTFVINKQPPNRQIWLSSPLSGPRRYDFDQVWRGTRDGEPLKELLDRELSQILKQKIETPL